MDEYLNAVAIVFVASWAEILQVEKNAIFMLMFR